jgi:hypothetical protein
MQKLLIILFASVSLISACSGNTEISSAGEVLEATVFSGPVSEYVLAESFLENECEAADAGMELTNQRVLDLRADGEAYLEASKRIEGWQVQFNCLQNPNLIVSVVVVYENFEGPRLTLSPDWHQEVLGKIEAGDLERLPNMPALGEDQIVFQDSAGTIGVEFIYRNLYLFLTGTAQSGEDNYDFFAELAKAQLDHLAMME